MLLCDVETILEIFLVKNVAAIYPVFASIQSEEFWINCAGKGDFKTN